MNKVQEANDLLTTVHNDRDKCDHCGEAATHHFLSSGYAEDLKKLQSWEHHLDLCNNCAGKE
jgi:hypothetical protein